MGEQPQQGIEPAYTFESWQAFLERESDVLIGKGWVTKRGYQTLLDELKREDSSSDFFDRLREYSRRIQDSASSEPEQVIDAEHQVRVGMFLRIRNAIEQSAPFLKVFDVLADVHPNQLTALRFPVAAVVLMLYQVNPYLATTLFGANAMFDWLDGAVARKTGKYTEDGKRFDPMMDKIINLSTLAYLTAFDQDLFLVGAVTITAVIDVINQRQRGPLSKQLQDFYAVLMSPGVYRPPEEEKGVQANAFGKVKGILQAAAIMALMLGQTSFASLVLIVAAPMALAGMLLRMKQAEASVL